MNSFLILIWSMVKELVRTIGPLRISVGDNVVLVMALFRVYVLISLLLALLRRPEVSRDTPAVRLHGCLKSGSLARLISRVVLILSEVLLFTR